VDDLLAIDVYAVITDPPWRVEHEAYESRVSVVIGSENESSPANLLQLWFKDPDIVMALGRELTTAGMRLAAQLRTPLPDSADAGQHAASEEYPMPATKPGNVESGEDR
jgi:hypothetical protein